MFTVFEFQWAISDCLLPVCSPFVKGCSLYAYLIEIQQSINSRLFLIDLSSSIGDP